MRASNEVGDCSRTKAPSYREYAASTGATQSLLGRDTPIDPSRVAASNRVMLVQPCAARDWGTTDFFPLPSVSRTEAGYESWTVSSFVNLNSSGSSPPRGDGHPAETLGLSLDRRPSV